MRRRGRAKIWGKSFLKGGAVHAKALRWKKHDMSEDGKEGWRVWKGVNTGLSGTGGGLRARKRPDQEGLIVICPGKELGSFLRSVGSHWRV